MQRFRCDACLPFPESLAQGFVPAFVAALVKFSSSKCFFSVTLLAGIMRFFLIDRITRWDVGITAEASKCIALSEDFFDDHFPRRPVMPGVLILEGMAQLSGLLLEASLEQKYSKSAKAVLTVLERTKFRAIVKPGDTLQYSADIMSINETGGKIKAAARRGDAIVTSTEMVFAFKYLDDSLMAEKRNRLLALWMNAG